MNKRRNIFNAVFLLLVFGVTIRMVFRDKDIGSLFDLIQSANTWYWALSVACVIAFILGEAVVIAYMLRTLGYRAPRFHCVLYSFVGFYFSGITPSASGGQPMQVYYMRKDRVPTPVATQVLLIVAITYKMVLVSLGLGVLILRPAPVIRALGPIMGVCYLGIALNVIAVGLMLLLTFSPRHAKSLLFGCVALLHRLRIVKRTERLQKRLEKSMLEYQDASDYFKTHKIVVWNVFLITVAQRLSLFVVTYFTFRSFGLTNAGFLTITLLQGMIAMAVDMLPLPGGMGITENLFLMVFAPFAGALTLPIMVVSRLLSFYTQLLLSALMTVVAHFAIKRRGADPAPE